MQRCRAAESGGPTVARWNCCTPEARRSWHDPGHSQMSRQQQEHRAHEQGGPAGSPLLLQSKLACKARGGGSPFSMPTGWAVLEEKTAVRSARKQPGAACPAFVRPASQPVRSGPPAGGSSACPGPCPLRQATHIINQLLDGLHHLHQERPQCGTAAVSSSAGRNGGRRPWRPPAPTRLPASPQLLAPLQGGLPVASARAQLPLPASGPPQSAPGARI